MIAHPKADVRQRAARRAFTLTELLVAMGIIVIITGITAVSVRALARDARLSSANNTIAAALDTARGIAIRDNRLTVVVFRPRLDGRRQYIEIVTAQWTGESPFLEFGTDDRRVVDRFEPVAGVATRRLPRGIKVGGPMYHSNDDDWWQTASHFPSENEFPGVVLGVMFASNGTVAMRNTVSDSSRLFVDFNNDGVQDIGESPLPWMYIDYEAPPGNITLAHFNFDLFLHHSSPGEPFVSLVPYLAVFDDDRCREEFDASEWFDEDTRTEDYTEYITNQATRIHFNRYTGVVMR